MKRILMILLSAFLALNVSAFSCSLFSQPSDKEVLQAIDNSGILKSDAFTVTAPLMIVKRGKRGRDGSWPVMVKMNLSIKMPDGQVSERENRVTFRIFTTTDSSGRKVWKAALSS